MASPVTRLARLGYAALGTTALGLGLAGVVLPLVPTTPFVLLAAFCFARSSPWAYNALLNNRVFGPMIRNWQRHRCISAQGKRAAVIAIAVTFTLTIAFALDHWALRLGLVALAVTLMGGLLRLPTCPADPGEVSGNSQPPSMP
ncbi:MAG: YbaN family protein [Candidatus Competibacterales bacterium]